MKKTIITLLGFFFTSINTFADTRAAVLLLHNGQGKTYEMNQLPAAVSDAVSGDTICLSEGSFDVNGKLLVDKAISIIGTGEVSRIIGNVDISINGEPTLTNRLLDAVRISGSVHITKEVRGLKFRKTWVGDTLTASAITKMEIDRCFINVYVSTSGIQSATFVGSILNYVRGQSTSNSLNYVNCSIATLIVDPSTTPSAYTLFDAVFDNCIIHRVETWGKIYNRNEYNNCILNNVAPTPGNSLYIDPTTMHNCYLFEISNHFSVNHSKSNDNFPTFSLESADVTADLLVNAGYIGTDGTAVGHPGSSTPYTLTPSGIYVTESLLKLDVEKKQLNVTLKVTSN